MGLLRDIGDKLAFWRDDPKVDDKFRDMTDEELKEHNAQLDREAASNDRAQKMQAVEAQQKAEDEYKKRHNGRSFADRTTTTVRKRVSQKTGRVYDEYPTSDVTEEVRKEDGESNVTRSIMDKYNKQFAPKVATPKRQVRTSEPETEEATINGQKPRIPKATKRQKQMFISNRGNAYYAWRAQQQQAYNRARRNAK